MITPTPNTSKQSTNRTSPKAQAAFGHYGHRRLKDCITFLLALLLPSMAARAQVIDWHPAITARIGDSISITDPTLSTEFAEPTSGPQFSNTGGLNLHSIYSQTKQDLAKSLSINSSVAVKSINFNVGATFDFIEKQEFSANTVNFAVNYRKFFPDETYSDFQIRPHITGQLNARSNDLDAYEWLRDKYGTHFVRGFKKSAYAMVVYRFTSESTSLVKDFRASLEAGYNGGTLNVDLNATLEKTFSDTRSAISLNYEVTATDPDKPIPFQIAGKFESFDDFLAFDKAFKEYGDSLEEENARVSGYILDDLRNLPTFPSSSNFNGKLILPGNVDEFMTVFSKVDIWRRVLTSWLSEANSTSWLREEKRTELVTLLKEVDAIRTTLSETAKRHIEDGEPLLFVDPLVDAVDIFRRIPTPAIHLWNRVNFGGGAETAFGVVNCGPKEWVVDHPFDTITLASPGATQFVFYSGADFLARIRTIASPGEPLWNFASSQIESNPIWQRWFQEAETGDCRIGFFFTTGGGIHPGTTFSILDGAGAVLDVVRGDDFGVDINCPEVDASAAADLRITPMSTTSASVEGQAVQLRWTLRNDGPSGNLETRVNFEIPTELDFENGHVSRGNITREGRHVIWEIGLLGGGREATMDLELKSIQAGRALVTANTLGHIHDRNSANNRANVNVEIEPAPDPVVNLSLTRNGGGQIIIEIEGLADLTGVVESSPNLKDWALWRMVNSATIFAVEPEASNGSHQFYRFRTTK